MTVQVQPESDSNLNKLTVKDIAREAGVSTATISRVLNNSGYVSEPVRAKVLQAIEKMNYQPNSIARSLKQEKTRSVGIILPDMTNPYFMTIARQIQRKLLNQGYHLLFMDSEEDAGKEREALAFLMEKRIEALILAGTGENRQKIEAVHNAGIHVILIDRKIEGLQVDIIAEDSRHSSEEAIFHLLERGHRHIGIINGPSTVITAIERFEGVAAAYRRFNIQLDTRYIYTGDYSRRSGMDAIRTLMNLSPRPTAIFSANNEMTYGLYLGLHELGHPLDELEVVSFGDLEFSPLFHNRLSVIRQNPLEIGNAAGELALSRLEREGKACECVNRLIFQPKMIRRRM
jgi:LacI family transcriptional regulator